MSKIHRRRPLGYRFALGALDAAERLRQIGSREAVQQMVYDQLRILGATQRTTSQWTNVNGQVERQMSRSPHPVEKAMALIPVLPRRPQPPTGQELLGSRWCQTQWPEWILGTACLARTFSLSQRTTSSPAGYSDRKI